jgi:hypothetical protein
VFLTDYFQGKAIYAALASYHAYLEFPVLLALLLAPAMLRSGQPSARAALVTPSS